MRSREEGEAVPFQSTIRKRIRHLEQGAVKQLGVEYAMTCKDVVNVGIRSISQSDGEVPGVLERDFDEALFTPKRELLVVRQTHLYQVPDEAVDLIERRTRCHRDRRCRRVSSLFSTAVIEVFHMNIAAFEVLNQVVEDTISAFQAHTLRLRHVAMDDAQSRAFLGPTDI